jgi:carbamoyltransferase
VTVLRSYEDRLSGWRSEADNGQAHAINLGFGRTRGEIMAWLNSDDLLLPGSLVRVADYFARHPNVDVVYGNRLLIDEQGREIGRWILPGHDAHALRWADYVPQETLFWRRSIWEKVGGRVDESFRFAMDWDLLIRFMDAGARFAHLPHFLGAFRVHNDQKTSSAIESTGLQEMTRIRQRVWHRNPSDRDVRMGIASFMMRHVLVDLVHRVGSRLGKTG